LARIAVEALSGRDDSSKTTVRWGRRAAGSEQRAASSAVAFFSLGERALEVVGERAGGNSSGAAEEKLRGGGQGPIRGRSGAGRAWPQWARRRRVIPARALAIGGGRSGRGRERAGAAWHAAERGRWRCIQEQLRAAGRHWYMCVQPCSELTRELSPPAINNTASCAPSGGFQPGPGAGAGAGASVLACSGRRRALLVPLISTQAVCVRPDVRSASPPCSWFWRVGSVGRVLVPPTAPQCIRPFCAFYVCTVHMSCTCLHETQPAGTEPRAIVGVSDGVSWV
jgi:hypothetical protein